MSIRKRESVKSSEASVSAASRAGLWVMAGVLALVFLLLHLWNLNERFLEFKWDGIALGNFTHLLWNLAQRIPVSTGSGAEIEWFRIPGVLYLLAPLYRLWPSPLFLLTVQTSALAIAAGAVFFMGAQYLPRIRALILTLFFCFYPPIYAMSSASFHPATLAVPFLTLMIMSATNRQPIRVICFAVCSLACDLRTGLLVVPVFLWLARNADDRRWLWAAIPVAAVGFIGQTLLPTEEGMGPVIFYGALTAPYLFWAFSALENWTDRALSKRSIFLTLLSPVFFAGAVFASAIMTPGMMEAHPGVSQLPMRKSAVHVLMDQIPADAQLLTTPLFLPRFSNRQDVGLLADMSEDLSANRAPRFALADLGAVGTDLDQTDETARVLRGLVRRGWGPIASLGGAVLFSEHPGNNLIALYSPVDMSVDRPFLVLQAQARDAIEMVGFTMSPDADDADIIHFSFYWKKIQDDSTDYAVQLTIVDAGGQSAHSVNRRLCYGLYPFENWKKGEVIKDEFSFVVPERLQNSSYEVRLGLRQFPNSLPVPMRSPVQGALDDQGRIRLIALDAI